MKYKVTLNKRVYEVEVEEGSAMLIDEYELAAPAAPAAPDMGGMGGQPGQMPGGSFDPGSAPTPPSGDFRPGNRQ